ncbi:MAG: FkbM family methyltransferase [Deltaproteobacteria bacterium]|nr:FkbM family methyltransferase [Deltaproteobacteria bacterium]
MLLTLLLVSGVGVGFVVYVAFFAMPPVLPGAISKEEIRRLVGKDDALVLDVGANDGTDTRGLLSVFPRGRVYAFEPDPRAIRRFRSNTNDPRAMLFEVAVGDRDGTIEFHVSDADLSPVWSMVMPEGWDQSGSIRKPKEVARVHPWITFERTILVKLMRLDTWSRENNIGHIDFMWVDIQGAERDLILGAPETLRRTRFFYTEYSDVELYEGEASLAEIMELLPDFKLIKRWPGDALFRNKRLD